MICAAQCSTISRPQIRRGLYLPLAPVALTDIVVNEAGRLFKAFHGRRSTTVEPINFVSSVHNADLSNARIFGQISRPSVQKRIKGIFNTYQMHISSSKTVTYIYIFACKKR